MVIDKGDGAAGGGAGASPASDGMYSGQHLRVSDAEREAAAGGWPGTSPLAASTGPGSTTGSGGP